MDSRICTNCAQAKPIDQFYKNGKKGCRRSRCIDCVKPAFNVEKKAREKRYRLEALTHYSGGTPQCNCCGESHIEFLTIDHINGGGNKHRKEIIKGSGDFVRWLRRQGYPNEYRVLCYNCNASRGLHGYCPHEKESKIDDVRTTVEDSHNPQFQTIVLTT